MRRVLVIASASGNGKTTLARALGARLGVPVVELDALVHGANWVETPNDVLRAKLEQTLALEGWVMDGGYRGKLGDLLFDAADTIVWLDLPMRIWLPRLARRTWRRWTGEETLWNGNRETLRGVFGGRESLFGYALLSHFRRRREYPAELARYRVIRLRTPDEVARFLDQAASVARTV